MRCACTASSSPGTRWRSPSPGGQPRRRCSASWLSCATHGPTAPHAARCAGQALGTRWAPVGGRVAQSAGLRCLPAAGLAGGNWRGLPHPPTRLARDTQLHALAGPLGPSWLANVLACRPLSAVYCWGAHTAPCPPAFSPSPHPSQVSFSLHILHIDESTALGLGPEEAAAARASVAAAAAQYVSPAAGTAVQYHCIPLEAVFEDQGSAREAEAGRDGHAADSTAPLAALSRGDAGEQQQRRLQSLLALVRDPTGRQDLARHLRTHLLLRCAALLGCSRVARGDCASTLATRIVAAASKGCGYSLPGDVQLLDARSAQIGAAVVSGRRGRERSRFTALRRQGGRMPAPAQAPSW